MTKLKKNKLTKYYKKRLLKCGFKDDFDVWQDQEGKVYFVKKEIKDILEKEERISETIRNTPVCDGTMSEVTVESLAKSL